MKLTTSLAFTVLLFASVATVSAAAHELGPALQEPPVVTSSTYRSGWADVGSCAQFKNKLWMLPVADNLIQDAAASKIAVKSEFESKHQFQERIERELSSIIKADSVYLIHALTGSWSTFDAERQTMTVQFPIYTRRGHMPVIFGMRSQTAKGSTYTGTNAFGVSKRVQRQTRVNTNVHYEFPTNITSQPITFPMNGSDAEMFKMGIGTMHILGRITKTNIRSGRSTPTLDTPQETAFTQHELTMQPRCAYITFGPELIQAWSYEAW